MIEDYKGRKRERLVGLFRDARYTDPDRLADEVFLLFEGARISVQCAGARRTRVTGCRHAEIAARECPPAGALARSERRRPYFAGVSLCGGSMYSSSLRPSSCVIETPQGLRRTSS